MTERLKIMAAGSLRHAFPAILAAFEAETGTQVNLCLGPAGLLRERIEQGEFRQALVQLDSVQGIVPRPNCQEDKMQACSVPPRTALTGQVPTLPVVPNRSAGLRLEHCRIGS